MRKKLRNSRRPRALFGAAESAAYITGALINAGATTTAAGIQAAAQMDAAKQQSESVESQAEQQARALEKQSDVNRSLEEKTIETQKETSNKIADAITANQMNLQMLAGNESMKERAQEGLIKVKYGGRGRKLKYGNNPYFPLQGGLYVRPKQYEYNNSNKIVEGEGNQNTSQGEYLYTDPNTTFRILDGGGVTLRKITPEGGRLYEILGNDHEHYHKTRSGKYKSGVGFKFGGTGDAVFISKHTNGGFNPVKAINNGMHPLEAYNIQEGIKSVVGVPDSKYAKYGRRLRCAGKHGGRVKAVGGTDLMNVYNSTRFGPISSGGYSPYYFNGINYMSNPTYLPAVSVQGQTIKPIDNINTDSLGSLAVNGFRTTEPGETVKIDYNNNISNPWRGNFYNALGQVGGAALGTFGNLFAGHKLSDAYRKQGAILGDAYDRLQGISDDFINNVMSDWRAATYLPAIRSANYNVNPQLQDVNRSTLRQQEAVRNNTLSSAARLNRAAGIEQYAQENRSKIYADQANKEEQIKQDNNRMINEAAARNIQARMDWIKSRAELGLQAAMYNNDIRNESILGKANALGQANVNVGNTKAQTVNAIGSSWANALSQMGQTAYDTANNIYKMDREEAISREGQQIAMSGRDDAGLANALLAMGNSQKNNPYWRQQASLWLERHANDNNYSSHVAQIKRIYGL